MNSDYNNGNQQTAELDATVQQLRKEATEQKQTSQKLHNSRSLLYRLIDGIQDGLLLLDYDGQVHAINQTFAKLLGTTPKDVVYRQWEDVANNIRLNMFSDSPRDHWFEKV